VGNDDFSVSNVSVLSSYPERTTVLPPRSCTTWALLTNDPRIPAGGGVRARVATCMSPDVRTRRVADEGDDARGAWVRARALESTKLYSASVALRPGGEGERSGLFPWAAVA
jgi:hypothetical protein